MPATGSDPALRPATGEPRYRLVDSYRAFAALTVLAAHVGLYYGFFRLRASGAELGVDDAGLAVLAIASVAATVGVAALSWYGLERWAIGIGRRLGPRLRRAQPSPARGDP